MTTSDHQRNRAEGASGINARQGRSSGGRVAHYAKEPRAAQSYGAAQSAAGGRQSNVQNIPYSAGPVVNGTDTQRLGAQGAPVQGMPVAVNAVPGAMPAGVPVVSAGQLISPAAPKKKRKHRAAFWVAFVVVIVCVVLACLLLLNTCDGKSKRQGSLGQLEGKTDEEIQAEINRVVDEGMFNISIASIVQMENGSAPAELRIENVPGNHYLMKVDIVRDDTGEKIYETDLIEPNYHIQEDTLDVSLPAGDYECTAIFQAFDMDTEESIGQAAAKILIQVAK